MCAYSEGIANMIQVKVHEAVATMRIKGLPNNVLDIQFLIKMQETLKQLEQNTCVKGIVISSANSVDASLERDLLRMTIFPEYSQKQIMMTMWKVYRVMKMMVHSRKIYTAALSGAVVGLVIPIIMACKYRFADETAWFGIPDFKHKGVLVGGSIDRIFSRAQVKQFHMSDRQLSVQKAIEGGFVHQIIKKCTVMDYADSFARCVVQHS